MTISKRIQVSCRGILHRNKVHVIEAVWQKTLVEVARRRPQAHEIAAAYLRNLCEWVWIDSAPAKRTESGDYVPFTDQDKKLFLRPKELVR